jgi:hypothetical protein
MSSINARPAAAVIYNRAPDFLDPNTSVLVVADNGQRYFAVETVGHFFDGLHIAIHALCQACPSDFAQSLLICSSGRYFKTQRVSVRLLPRALLAEWICHRFVAQLFAA